MKWGVVVLLGAVPFVLPSQSMVNIAMLAAFSAFLGQCWNIAGGFGGLTSFGHAVFFGCGAYTGAILQTRYGVNPWLGLPAAFVVGGVVGAGIGAASFRAGLRGSYFALVTLAFAEVFRVLSNSLDFTQGGLGIAIPLKVSVWNFQFADRRATYAVVLVLLAVATGVAAWLTKGRMGARLAAVRENEDAAAALGVDIVRTKTWALAVSGGLTAMGGVVYGQTYLYIDPSIGFGTERSVEMLLVAMIGGAGTVWGPVLGAVVLHLVADVSRAFIATPGFAPMLYGVVLLVIIAVLPQGLAGVWARVRVKQGGVRGA